MQFQEYCDIQVSGQNPYRFIHALRQSAVICIEQRCIGEVFHAKVLRRDLPVVQQLASDFRMVIEVQEHRSYGKQLRRFRLRFGFLIGVMLGTVLIFWQSNRVETIEVEGNTIVDAQTVLSILEEEGVSRGRWIGDIDMLHCENRLRIAIPEVAWAGLRHTGNRLVVQIAEVRPNVEMLHERVPCNIVAKYDAQITDVTVHAGTLCHHPGDGVAKGELLISGVHTDKPGQSTFLHANGKIIGIYQREAELTRYVQESETRPTGKLFQKRALRIFGMKIPLTAGKSEFSESHTLRLETPLYFLGFRLPCSLLLENDEETVTEVIQYSEDEVKLALNEDIIRYEKNLLSDVTILQRDIRYEPTQNGITAHLVYQVEGDIGEMSEIFMIP